MLSEASELAERFDDDLLRARVAELRGHSVLYHGDLPAAIALLEDARTRFRALGEPLGEFDTLVLLAAATFFLEDPRDGDFSQQALALAEQYGALSSKGYALWCVGVASWRVGEYDRADENLRESVRLFQPLHDLTGIGFGVQALSWCAASPRPTSGRRGCWGHRTPSGGPAGRRSTRPAPTARSRRGCRKQWPAVERRSSSGPSRTGRRTPSTRRWRSRWERPTADHRPPLRARAGAEAPGGLTRREREIAGLLAEGLTNREIAARLVIAQRTAETHVDHILSKLGMTSRAQVAGWVADAAGPLTRAWPSGRLRSRELRSFAVSLSMPGGGAGTEGGTTPFPTTRGPHVRRTDRLLSLGGWSQDAPGWWRNGAGFLLEVADEQQPSTGPARLHPRGRPEKRHQDPTGAGPARGFAHREVFSLGTVYVEKGVGGGVFHSLMDELAHNDAAWGVVVPDLRHLTVVEQLVLTGHEEGARTAIFTANFTPRSGGPGVGTADTRQARRSTSRAVR